MIPSGNFKIPIGIDRIDAPNYAEFILSCRGSQAREFYEQRLKIYKGRYRDHCKVDIVPDDVLKRMIIRAAMDAKAEFKPESQFPDVKVVMFSKEERELYNSGDGDGSGAYVVGRVIE